MNKIKRIQQNRQNNKPILCKSLGFSRGRINQIEVDKIKRIQQNRQNNKPVLCKSSGSVRGGKDE
jgi:predicted RNA-binding Zn-ribbon protein involved in translation (DUF1610 family)